ncbi:MAG TPA: D-aminoacyl-tRNA deacylase, partial [Nitrososphaerales archaeon]|nr:D-aminoacyl-tRNA deacylase [Nitrososphaerales archaeon]
TNIHERLVEEFDFAPNGEYYDGMPVYLAGDSKLISSSKQILILDDLDSIVPDPSYVFISKHQSESMIPSLTAHFPGNFGPSDFGGQPKEIARYSPSLLKRYFLSLNSKEEVPEGYNITLEATHHGPTSLKGTALFVELGSSPEQWKDKEGARCIARALLATLKSNETFEKCAIAIGGTHYPQKFNKFLLDSEFSIGPVVPKHALEYFDREMIEQIIQKSDQKITHAVLDAKGLSIHKQKVVNLVRDFGLEIVKL